MIHSLSYIFAGLALSMFLSGCVQHPELPIEREQVNDLSDADRDGVITVRDQCPQTPEHALTNNEGCSMSFDEAIGHATNFHFAYDSSQLSKVEFYKVEQLVEILNQHPHVQLMLMGDTSPEGSLQYNQKLAERRVASVERAMEQQGISASRFVRYDFSSKQVAHIKDLRQRRTLALIAYNNQPYVMAWWIYNGE
ncbi:OmpA family protein [Echinimonas agarilytica]|uniref:OmpA family protein n=1 Tax=Echinimonas agarilytica TaxID=1215918 RepID=A0AA41W5I5_9GAMM|nr:OmpA family protein [Echinimonas agarilytica]MCM2679034.1 OmpA family protein [Echinimonas agarilytica]